MKKGLSKIGSLVILSVLLLNSTIVFANGNSQAKKIEENNIKFTTKEMVDDLEKYIIKKENGKIEMVENVPEKFKEKYPIESIRKRLEQLNKEAITGKIEINDDLSITRYSKEKMLHHSKDYRDEYWWGVSIGYCGTCAKNAVYELRNGANNLGIVGIFLPPVVLADWYFTGLANSMDHYRTTNGVVVDMNLAFVYNCYGR